MHQLEKCTFLVWLLASMKCITTRWYGSVKLIHGALLISVGVYSEYAATISKSAIILTYILHICTLIELAIVVLFYYGTLQTAGYISQV